MRKLKNNKGFTLVEMLACVITLLLLAGICSAGSELALRSLNQSTYESNSQVLENTLDMYICDILRHARLIETVETDENLEDVTKEVLKFTNSAYQIYDGKIAVDASGKYLAYLKNEGGREILLLGENMYAGSLYISDFKLFYNHEKHYFTGSYKIKSTILEDAERECTFTCRTIAEY